MRKFLVSCLLKAVRFDRAFLTHGRQPGCCLENEFKVFPELSALGTGKNSTPQFIGKFDAFVGGESK